MPPRPTAAPSLFPETPTSNPPATKKTDWINAHCDGGARGNPGPAGYGALIQDNEGTVLAELSEFLGMRTNNYAEYSGLLGCLQYALDHHHPRLRVVSDSELMVKQIQGKYKVNSPDLKPLWQEAKNRIAKLEAFEITHALRHKNKDADRLANEAMDRGMRRGPATGSSSGQPAAPPIIKANPYPTKSEAPPNPYAKADAMLRGFTKDGVVHILGGATLPDGVFVKIIRE
ncbi:ribonuclease HI family protein [Tunturibacter psychrotolerans]|uniref:Ribonuclease HI family protein n=1 Tax=Tunturiibacter psychrotolerans TaxID=3069686 RepID=A0AAU7ZTF3_9BACT